MDKATHIYIGRAKCGCVVAARSDYGDRSTANDVAQFIRDGYTIERVELASLRNGTVELTGCTCRTKPAKQPEPNLFGGAA